MPDWIRQRPLTCLFAVAVACVFAVGMTSESWNEAATVILIGWTYVVGAAAALSQRHRLVRAAMFLAGVAAAEVWLLRFERFQPETLSLLMVMSASAFVSALAMRALLQLAIPPRRPEPRTKWQFSVMEALGWMIVVAVISTALRFSRVEWFANWTTEGLYLLHGALAGTLAGLFLTPQRHCDRVATVLVTLLVVAVGVFPAFGRDWLDDDQVFLPMYGLLGLWILVQRLDEAAEERAEKLPALAVVRREDPESEQTSAPLADGHGGAAPSIGGR